jgi:hypothetical protein
MCQVISSLLEVQLYFKYLKIGILNVPILSKKGVVTIYTNTRIY